MTPTRIRAKVIAERSAWITKMIRQLRLLPLGILSKEEGKILTRIAGYRNRMVHFYQEISIRK